MNDNQGTKNDFIREQIKEKPLNKKKYMARVGMSALSGAVFALSASVVFAVVMPYLPGEAKAKEAGLDTEQLGLTETVTEEVTENTETENTETENTESEQVQGKPVEHTGAEMELSLEHYQKIHNQLYSIGNVANRSIVTITSVKSEQDWFSNSFETEGQGSGIIIKESGNYLLILTEKKIISDANRMSVTFQNGAIADAKLRKYDANSGIAIIQVDKQELDQATLRNIEVAKLGNSKLVTKGSIVLALGSPLGTNYSILTGNITSTENSISKQDDNYSVFTTDIVGSKNGNGVLVNVDGEVIGIIMQGQSTAEGGNTLTAFGISDVKSIIEFLIKGRDIPYLGTSVITVSDKIASAYEIPRGVYIKEVAVDSPAMLAGLQSGDVITKVDKVEVSTVDSYNEAIMKMVPEQEYAIIVMRQGANGYYEVRCKVVAGVME